MNIALFLIILTIGATASGLFTEAVKKAFQNANKNYSANALALLDALVIGGGGTAVVYQFMDIPWTANNIISLCIMVLCVWVGSMVGYDKVIQLVKQIKEGKNDAQ